MWIVDWVYPRRKTPFKETIMTASEAREIQKGVVVIREEENQVKHDKELSDLMKRIKNESKAGRDKVYLNRHEPLFKINIDRLRKLGYCVYYIESGYFWVISWNPQDTDMEKYFG